jgi:hypothetical protein
MIIPKTSGRFIAENCDQWWSVTESKLWRDSPVKTEPRDEQILVLEEFPDEHREHEYIEVLLGDLDDDIAVKHGENNLFLRPIYIENAVGERDVLCYVPQDLSANENEPFAQMVCGLLRAGMQEAFQGKKAFRMRRA